jgi:hypothetical protein
MKRKGGIGSCRPIFVFMEEHMGKLENKFQSELIEELYSEFPDCIILKNDPSYLQGIPDLEIIFRDKYAFLECKKEEDARKRPNQGYYVDLFNDWSFSRFIFPENKDFVLSELREWFNVGDLGNETR